MVVEALIYVEGKDEWVKRVRMDARPLLPGHTGTPAKRANYKVETIKQS